MFYKILSMDSHERWALAVGGGGKSRHSPPSHGKIMKRKSKLSILMGGSGSGLYSGGLTWSIVLRCDDHTGIFTCDGCTRDPYFYVPAETQSYVIKLSCSRKVLAASGD